MFDHMPLLPQREARACRSRQMLAVQRPSVTTALYILEGNGFIRAKRGQITVLDRDSLIEFADGTYGAPEAEYLRLLGKPH